MTSNALVIGVSEEHYLGSAGSILNMAKHAWIEISNLDLDVLPY